MPTPLYPLPYPPLCSKVRGVARLVKVNVFAPRPAYGAPAAKSTSVSLLPAHQIALQKLQTQLQLGRSTIFQLFLEAGACFPRLAAEISRRYSHAPHARRQRTPPGKHYAYAPGSRADEPWAAASFNPGMQRTRGGPSTSKSRSRIPTPRVISPPRSLHSLILLGVLRYWDGEERGAGASGAGSCVTGKQLRVDRAALLNECWA